MSARQDDALAATMGGIRWRYALETCFVFGLHHNHAIKAARAVAGRPSGFGCMHAGRPFGFGLGFGGQLDMHAGWVLSRRHHVR